VVGREGEGRQSGTAIKINQWNRMKTLGKDPQISLTFYKCANAIQ
jgi:hypothetical protein